MAQVIREVEECVCDICGENADGEYYDVSYLNGSVFLEMYCPIDLCKKHMRVFASEYSNYAYERYDGKGDTEKLIKKMELYDDMVSMGLLSDDYKGEI